MEKLFVLNLILIAVTVVYKTEAQSVNLEELRYYEEVEPLHIQRYNRNKRDLSTNYGEGQHFDETRFIVTGHNRHFDIKLHKNKDLLAASFTSIKHDENGDVIKLSQQPENCFYHGELEGKEDTFVVLSTCNGLSGLIHDSDGEDFYIEPMIRNNNSHIMYNIKDLKIPQKHFCGNNDSHTGNYPLDYSTQRHHLKRKRRNVGSDRKYLEMIAVVDHGKFKAWGSSLKESHSKTIELLNYVDMVYKTLNMRIALVSVVVWNIANMITIEKSAGATLRKFQRYTKDVLYIDMAIQADNAQLIAHESFNDNIVGMAGVGTICMYRSCAINHYHHPNAAIAANTMAHELGHNLGFNHVTDSCNCADGPCVMTSHVASSQVKGFTDCSIEKFSDVHNNGGYPCLMDYPDKLFPPPKCGNGYKEEGEQCDCGNEQECKLSGVDKCCNSTTCRLHESAQCADGACCQDCKFKDQGVKCRPKFHSECDLEEFCNGESNECPRNFHLLDGTTCDNDNGYCYQGFCSTHSAQCEVLWGTNGTKAIDECYRENLSGDIFGNCGKDLRDNYVSCSVENMFCGKIQCKEKPGKSLPDSPLIGSSREKRRRRLIVKSTSYLCTVAKVTFGIEGGDPTITKDGTKCGNSSVCINGECTQSPFSNLKSCAGICKNGGVCNNNGNCHCPSGFACPHCELAGIGGSYDSGQGCIIRDNSGCLSTLVKAMLVFFLLVVPLVAFATLCYCRRKDELRLWLRAKKHNRNDEKRDRNSSVSFVGQHTAPARRPPPPPPPTHT